MLFSPVSNPAVNVRVVPVNPDYTKVSDVTTHTYSLSVLMLFGYVGSHHGGPRA
jgi:hypothetical protein